MPVLALGGIRTPLPSPQATRALSTDIPLRTFVWAAVIGAATGHQSPAHALSPPAPEFASLQLVPFRPAKDSDDGPGSLVLGWAVRSDLTPERPAQRARDVSMNSYTQASLDEKGDAMQLLSDRLA